uniref:Uncharacterized protein n=1 Tax=Setaria viridis TaxID=4556 RepID=A0A4U6VHJ4_SETVI|nr:hypothetical protein SEVIR_3G291200v2 [Setaria viridis]
MVNGSCSWHHANGKETWVHFIRLLIGELFLLCCVPSSDDHSAIGANNQFFPRIFLLFFLLSPILSVRISTAESSGTIYHFSLESPLHSKDSMAPFLCGQSIQSSVGRAPFSSLLIMPPEI